MRAGSRVAVLVAATCAAFSCVRDDRVVGEAFIVGSGSGFDAGTAPDAAGSDAATGSDAAIDSIGDAGGTCAVLDDADGDMEGDAPPISDDCRIDPCTGEGDCLVTADAAIGSATLAPADDVTWDGSVIVIKKSNAAVKVTFIVGTEVDGKKKVFAKKENIASGAEDITIRTTHVLDKDTVLGAIGPDGKIYKLKFGDAGTIYQNGGKNRRRYLELEITNDNP